MKILITGYSGSGKSTLCRKLQERYELPSLHLDAVQFLPAWKTRAKAEQQRVVQAFLDEHPDGYPNKAIVIRNQRDLTVISGALLRSHPKLTFGGVCRAPFVDLGWERPRQELNLKRKDSGMNPES